MHKRTQLSTYFADNMHKLFKICMKPDVNSIENSADPDHLASSAESTQNSADPADRDPHCFHTTWHYEFILIN